MRKGKAAAADAHFPEKASILFRPARYKVMRGGRGSAKSMSAAQALAIIGSRSRKRVLCTREYQNSIAASVHRVLSDQMRRMGLAPKFYDVKRNTIVGANGTEFLFAGLRHNINSIRSTEGVDICWIEEGQSVSKSSWEALIPTIRAPGSEIWVTYNPEFEDDPTHLMFTRDAPPDALIAEMNWRDNPWFPDELDVERRRKKITDPDGYDHIWEGRCRKISAATIFRGKFVVENFETPRDGVRFFHGADWGFANDPTALVRCWIRGDDLMVDYEAGGVGIDFEHLPRTFDEIPTARDWPIKADSARPETISFMHRQGFNITAAKKWPGSVEDGISHLRGFSRIVIHEDRCPRTAREFRLYRYKTDQNGDVLPIIIDADNHFIDAIRYSLDGFITSRGVNKTWEKLAE